MDYSISVLAVDFFTTDIGKVIKAGLAALGVIAVIAAVVMSIGSFLGGKVGKGVKTIAAGVLVGAFCIRPELFSDLLTLAGNLLGQSTDTAEQIVQQAE